jgi:hypothetical protein
MASFLTFLAVINLAGFTLIPYIVGKQGPLNCYMPLHVAHKLFVWIQFHLILGLMLFNAPALEAAGFGNVSVFLAVISFAAASDLLFGWRKFVFDPFTSKDERLPYVKPCNDIRHDFKYFSNVSYTLSGKFNSLVITVQDARIVADVANFALMVILINLFL